MMAERKLGVWMSEPLEALIHHRDDQLSLSQRLSAVADRYRYICDEMKPELSEAEWNALRDVLNGYWLLSDARLGLSGIAINIIDGDLYDNLGAKWGIDAKALAAKVDAMDAGTTVALVEAVEKWWAETRD